ncbi:hypothetical protein [Massilia putida]|uniref:hypothetical protein n=1 Tax=Massilia putida TaxID=1141883 RepID=UPI000AEE51D3|nr:hypothetical protein [Massilia putida]
MRLSLTPLTLTLALAGTSVQAAPPFTPSAAVAPAVLDGCRGGFTTTSGLVVSLGIERIVTVDGQVAARSELRLGDLGGLVGGTSHLSAQAAGQLAQLTGGTVVQNGLNDRTISTATIIQASVGTQGLMQAMHFQTTLANALNAAATGK